MHDTDKIEAVLRYHERTKHHFDRYAPGPGELDWANQPNPFRRYEGAPLVRLPLLGPDDEPASPHYDDLYRRGSVPSMPVTIRSLSRLLQYGLAISAWKQVGATRWALRCNPSSGNLHPTEGYVLIGALPGLATPRACTTTHHASTRSSGAPTAAPLMYAALMREFPAQAFLVGLSSIHWREAWKYGERAFRYCQHDAGHAIGALRIAAATLGWSSVAAGWPGRRGDRRPARLEPGRGLRGAEREHPVAVLAVWPTDVTGDGQARTHHGGPCAPRFGPRAPTDSRSVGMVPRTDSAATIRCAGRSSTKSPPPRANRSAKRKGSTRSQRPGSSATASQATTALWPDRSSCSGEACWPAMAGRRSRPNASTGSLRA